ncbi:MAG: Gfo/Idh/MocA family oxidoreductase [Clostridiaceae bacterium]|nr:Gfo/Idh/MocA family oxidoreductase [Clostridiaceae bacterium]
MVNYSDGMNFAPAIIEAPVVKPGEFNFAVMSLEHGHIYGMTNGLLGAGGTLKLVYDKDPEKVKKFVETYPQVKVASSAEEILQSDGIQMIAAADVPNLRGPLGVKIMQHGKHYFTDKTPFTTLEQIDAARKAVVETGKRFFVYYGERLASESGMYAGELVKQGAIGRVIQLVGLGPHRLNAPARPDWFFKKEQYGGIIIDLACHQLEQFLYYTGNTDGTVTSAQVGNYGNPQFPELEDFGSCHIVGENGATMFCRVDWLTPDGLRSWGDGRTFILGTEGYIEMRKYINVGVEGDFGDLVFLVDGKQERVFDCQGKVGFPFFGQMIDDCLYGTENAMTQAHIFKASELSIKAQNMAVVIT